jgi:hypothetical protein
LKEYGIENEELSVKHKHACVGWYRRSHMSKMDFLTFNEPKPPKDWNERIELTKSKLAKESVQWRANLNIISGQIKSGTEKAKTNVMNAADKAKTNAKSTTQKAKEKEITQKMG